MSEDSIAARAAREIRHFILCADCKTRGIPGTKKFNWPLCDGCIQQVNEAQPLIEFVLGFISRAIEESRQGIPVEEKLPEDGDSALIFVPEWEDRDIQVIDLAEEKGDV